MSFFKDPQNNLHFLDDDAFEYLLPEGSVLITDAEAEEIRATATARASASPAAIIAAAQAALDKSDIQVLRCYETSAPLPAAWVTYRQQLRDVISGRAAGSVPEHPAWP
jgi:methionyl-tRNA formyltransferase